MLILKLLVFIVLTSWILLWQVSLVMQLASVYRHL